MLPSPSDKKAVIIFFLINYGVWRPASRISLSQGSVLSREYFSSSLFIITPEILMRFLTIGMNERGYTIISPY